MAPRSVRLMLACAMTGALALSAVVARAADAVPAFYAACDGYGAPTDTGDGMNRPAISNVVFGPGGGDRIERSEPAAGGVGIAACDAALTVLPDRYWMRRVSLLRARAMRRLELSDPKGAIADLDQADRVGAQAGDLWYARSVGLGVAAIRARALRDAGDPVRAAAIMQAAAALRPYDWQAADLGLAALGPDADAATVKALRRTVARLNPQRIDTPTAARVETVRDLWRRLPDPETAGRQPPHKHAMFQLKIFGDRTRQFGEGGEGYSDFPLDTAGAIAVLYHAIDTGTADGAGEMALLRAAELAQRAGKAGLIIVRRRDAVLEKGGIETELDVVFVDPLALPPTYANAAWQVIEVADVRAQLAPIYDQTGAARIQ